MRYSEGLIDWYNLTLKLITVRINEEKNKTLTSEQVGTTISNHFKFIDHSELYDKVCESGIKLYEEIHQLF